MEPVVVWSSSSAVVLDKPAGWLTVPATAGRADPRPVLGVWAQERLGRLWPVHRLDEPVSGLVVFARDAETHRALSRCFEQRTVHKTYEALSALGAGAPTGSQRWVSRLVAGKRRAFEAAHGQEAITVAEAQADGAALRWTLRPETGRRHQLRVELARRGWPILGDALYGGPPWSGAGIALRAVRLDGLGGVIGVDALVVTGLPTAS